MNRGRLLPRVILTTPLASFPRTSILVLILFTCFATRAVAVSAALPNNTLGLFVVSAGALPTDYTAVGPVDATSFLFSMVIPSTKQWVELDKETSESYASNTMYVFEQDSNVYQVVAQGANTNYIGPCDFSHVAGTTGPSIPALSNGCTVDHLGYVGNSVYFRVPNSWDTFSNCYCIGGEFQVMTNNKATTLLSRTDVDNQATMDIADNGTLYAITHDTKNGTLEVWTRNLTTGHLETLLRNYAITESLFSGCCSFKINDGILYLGMVFEADRSVQILATDLTVPLASQTVPGVLQTYPASAGVSGVIYVDNGKVAQWFSSSSTSGGIAVLDVATGSTQYYDMGSKIQITGFAPLWIPGPQAGPTVTLATAGQVEPFAAESIVSAYGTNLAGGTTSAATLPLPTSLDGNTVTVTDSAAAARQAPLFYVSPSQTNFEIPAGTATGTATVMFQNQNGTTQSATISIGSVSPGIFELNGSWLVAAWVLPVISGVQKPLQPVYQVVAGNVVALPISLGPSTEQVYLEMYGTGIRNAKSVTATVGGLSVPVTFSGAAPGFAGEDQVNIGPLPLSLAGKGSVNILLTADGQAANTVNVTIQ